MCEPAKKTINVFPQPVAVKSGRTKNKNTSAYYNCLLNASLNNFNGQTISQVCRGCKLNGNDLNSQRNQEITQLMSAYEQLGSSLRSLLTPLHD
ncbi:MAG: hypothetical protein GBAus27B_000274 [Mycoplasmataceae bacterium]|nr:MAG: hypothetical protein GBAus27B_000274 [Mycoplasmataceae bacterium]